MPLPDLFDLNGQTALVTGAESGIGYAISEALAEAGARTILADLDESAADRAASALAERGLSARAIHVDVSDRNGLDRMIDDVARDRLDIMVANAGISAGPSHAAPEGRLEAITPEAWDASIGVNLSGTFATIRAAARHMVPAGAGQIIVTASISGMKASPVSGYAYVAAKAALINVVRQAAVELGPSGVRINAIAPGFIVTNLAGGILGGDEALAQRLSGLVPLGRVGRADELKGVALFLASKASSYVTGAVIPVDGGVTVT